MNVDAARRLLDALDLRQGIVCAVGAGGKKSTLRRLLEALRLVGAGPLASTATVMVAPPADDPALALVVAPPEDLADRVRAALATHRSVAYAGPWARPQRLAGVPPDLIRDLHRELGFVVTLVKADGARMRLIKAPAATEPVLPPGADLILPLVSAEVLGRPLDERVAHRVDRLGALLGVAPGQPLEPHHLATLLASPDGALKGAGAARVVPIINAVEGADRLRLARRAAEQALARSGRFDRVILATMIRADAVVEIVRR